MHDQELEYPASHGTDERGDWPNFHVQPSPMSALIATIIAATIGIGATNYFLFSRPDSIIWAVQEASGGWINANLVLFAPLSLIIIGGLVMGWGRQGLADLGLRGRWVMQTLLFLIGGWVIVQSMAVAAALLSAGGIAIHPSWNEHGMGVVLGYLVAMVIGTALFEDGVFRGYLLPQFCLRLEQHIAGPTARAMTALLLCSAIFSLWHLPTIILNRDLALAAIIGVLAYMLLGGLMLGLLFLRTGNLPLVIAAHALVNAPTLVVQSPVSGSLLAGLVGLGAIIAGPALIGSGWRAGLIIPVARQIAAPG